MSAIKYRELKHMYESYGPERTVKHLREALREGQLKAEDFSLRELAEATVGPEWVKRLDPRSGDGVRLLEAGDAVDVTAFSNITGQIVYSRILAGLHAGGVRRLEAGRHHSHAVRRREDSRHRPRRATSWPRCGRACPIPASA